MSRVDVMNRVLITGIHSYIGNSLAAYLQKVVGDTFVLDEFESGYNKKYIVDRITLRDDTWKEVKYSDYDTIIHAAAIVHSNNKKDTDTEYYNVNVIKTIELARIAKNAGVKQFIFFSSMSVYGISDGVITKDTKPNPNNIYGITKYKAEIELLKLNQDDFRVCIIRPPMVYGKGCKGNYQKLRKFTLASKIIPDYRNSRSMIYIENLNMYIEYLIDKMESGIFHPQNDRYVTTSNMMKEIAKHNKKSRLNIAFLNPIINVLIRNVSFVKKIFGDLTYDSSLNEITMKNYISFEDSIRETET